MPSRSRASIATWGKLARRIAGSSWYGGRDSGKIGLLEAVGLVKNARLDVEGDIDPVPGVDGHDRECQVGDFLLRQLRTYALVDSVLDAVGGNLGQGFGPGQAGAFARRKQVRFAPDGHVVQAQRALAVDGGALYVHVDAEGTAVDLGNTHLDELADRLFDRGVAEGHGELEELLEQFRGLLLVVDAHGVASLGMGEVGTGLRLGIAWRPRNTRPRDHGVAHGAPMRWPSVGADSSAIPGQRAGFRQAPYRR